MFMIKKPWSSVNQQASEWEALLGTLVCLLDTHVLTFPVNTIIAWEINIYHKHGIR